jgi:hypothetical protein
MSSSAPNERKGKRRATPAKKRRRGYAAPTLKADVRRIVTSLADADDADTTEISAQARERLAAIGEAMVRGTADLAYGITGVEGCKQINCDRVRRAVISRMPKGARRYVDEGAMETVRAAPASPVPRAATESSYHSAAAERDGGARSPGTPGSLNSSRSFGTVVLSDYSDDG